MDIVLAVRLLTFAAFLLWAGCSTGNYGNFKHRRDVAQAFETYHVFPEHRYYYLNQENNPYAVVALQNTYRMGGNMWREFDPRSDKLEKVVGLVKDFPMNYSSAYGSIISDYMGKQIGYWYSSLRIKSLKVDDENKYVSFYTDTPWLRDNDRGFGGSGAGVGVGSGGGSGIGIILGR